MNQSNAQTTRQNSPNSNLVKQILDCCKMYPAATALNIVPQATVLRAARKVGLVGDYNQLVGANEGLSSSLLNASCK